MIKKNTYGYSTMYYVLVSRDDLGDGFSVSFCFPHYQGGKVVTNDLCITSKKL